MISEEEKQKYQKLAEEDRERYRREVMGDYGKGASKGGSRRGRRKKEPGQPKRNMSVEGRGMVEREGVCVCVVGKCNVCEKWGEC